MIQSADEFVRLRSSEDSAEKVIKRYPSLWATHSRLPRTVPMAILEQLRHDPDWRVRSFVCMRNVWRRTHLDDPCDDAHPGPNQEAALRAEGLIIDLDLEVRDITKGGAPEDLLERARREREG